jgi:hypothetical protein
LHHQELEELLTKVEELVELSELKLSELGELSELNDLDDVEEDKINPALAVGAVVLGLDESDQFDRIRGTAEYGLEVDVTRVQGTSAVSGKVIVTDVDGHMAQVTPNGYLAISGIVNIGEDIEINLCYTDIRSYGKDFELYYKRAQDEYNVRFIRSRVASIEEISDSKNLKVKYVLDEQPKEEEFELVVLSIGMQPPSTLKN